MEPIQSTLKKWMQQKEGFKENFARIRKEVTEDPEIKEFLALHPELTRHDVDRNLIRLYEYKTQSKQCDKCASIGGCVNMLKGYSPILRVADHEIYISYEKCHLHIQDEHQKEQQRLVQSLYMPKEILRASFDQFDNDISRTQAIRESITFCNDAKDDLPPKGLYFSGPFGVGKTYFLGAIANKLKELHISSLLIYMPEFVREIKTAIKDDTINEKIQLFKETDVLMLDDIGAESQSAWFRDEILGSILQYRMMENLPVFFTSNYTMGQLQDRLAITSRGGVEKVKAGRIMERIKQTSKEIPISGTNRRDES